MSHIFLLECPVKVIRYRDLGFPCSFYVICNQLEYFRHPTNPRMFHLSKWFKIHNRALLYVSKVSFPPFLFHPPSLSQPEIWHSMWLFFIFCVFFFMVWDFWNCPLVFVQRQQDQNCNAAAKTSLHCMLGRSSWDKIAAPRTKAVAC